VRALRRGWERPKIERHRQQVDFIALARNAEVSAGRSGRARGWLPAGAAAEGSSPRTIGTRSAARPLRCPRVADEPLT